MKKHSGWARWIKTVVLAGAVLLGGARVAAQGAGATGAGGGFGGGVGGGVGGAGGVGGGVGGAGGLGGGLGGGMAGATGGGLAGTANTGGLGFSGGMIGTPGGVGRQGTTGGVQATNPFLSYYASPQALGYPGVATTPTVTGAMTRTPTFGQPTYGMTTAAATTATAGTGAPGGFVSASSIGVLRAPAYITTLGFEHRPPAGGVLQGRLQGVLDRSYALREGTIRLAVSGQNVLLQGTVTNDRQRRLAEAIVRLEPGVHDVLNRLVVKSGASGP